MNITVRNKLVLTISLIVGLIIINAAAVNILERKSDSLSQETLEQHNETIILKSRLVDHLKWNIDLLESISGGKEFTGETDPAKCAFGKWYNRFKTTAEYTGMDKKKREIFDGIEKYHSALHASAAEINREPSTPRKFSLYNNETRPGMEKLQSLFNEYMAEIDASMESHEAEMLRFQMISRIISIILVAVIVAAASVFGIIIFRGIMQSLRNFQAGFSRITEGDLTAEVEKLYDDEFGALAERFNFFSSRIRNIMTEILDMASQLATSSEELSAASVTFSDNAQSQASATEEVTATIEEISAGMEGVAAGAVQQAEKLNELILLRNELSEKVIMMQERIGGAMKLSENIALQAKTGENSLSEMSRSMQKIGASSGEVSNIVQIINDISEKINLLSLNAAIEAARAGDSGRGFAVVADEISKLAEQTASSIKEIDRFIRINEEEIKSGLESVNSSVEIISGIIHGVGEISSMMSLIGEAMVAQVDVYRRANQEMHVVKKRSDEIKISSEEQKTATEEIVRSIADITNLTQTTASGAEEMSANTEEIAGMAERLRATVNFFTV